MEIKLKVMVNGKMVNLHDALKKKLIKIEHDALVADDNVLLKLSTNVFDEQGQEIFFEDVLYNNNNEIYIVKNINGTAYLYRLDDGKYSIFSTLSSVQFKNKIDLIKQLE